MRKFARPPLVFVVLAALGLAGRWATYEPRVDRCYPELQWGVVNLYAHRPWGKDRLLFSHATMGAVLGVAELLHCPVSQ